MLVLLKATYPPSGAKKVTDLFMSPQTPKRSPASKEIASFAYSDGEGLHGLFILEVENDKFSDFMQAQAARNTYLQSRAEGLQIEVIPGSSVVDALSLTSKHLA
jgi:hypothetical protein